MARFSFILAMLVSLAGCSTTQQPIVIGVQPQLITYSPEQMARVSEQLRECLPDCADLGEFITDYGQLRDAIRAGSE